MSDLKFTTAADFLAACETKTTEWGGKEYDSRHGGPFDRGSADSYYQRGINPHYYVGATSMSDKIESDGMTEEEIQDYLAGYEYNEELGSFKEW